MSVKIVDSLSEEEWRHFVYEHPQGNVFHTPEMFQVLSRAEGYHPTLWAAVTGNGHVLALLVPSQVTLLDGLARYFTTRAVAYGGVLCVPGVEGREALARLLRTYKREVKGAPLFTELRNLADMSTVQPILSAEGFAYEDHLNYLIDLDRSPEAILQGFSRSTRQTVRRWLRRGGATVEEACERSQLAICCDLLRQTYRAAHVPLPDRSLFEAAFDLLQPPGMIRILLARVGEAYASCVLQLVYKDVIYAWYGGLDRAYASHTPNEILFWHALRWGAENGYRVFDFGGAGKPDEDYGPRRFKSKFGGTLVNYGRNTCVHAPARLKLSQVGYQLMRRLL